MVLFFTLTLMVGVFMWDSIVESMGAVPARSWRTVPGIHTACALWWVFIAETYRTGAVWALYQLGKREADTGAFFAGAGYASSIGYLIAGFSLIGGLLRAIYIFTPPEWKRRVWVYASIAAVVFVLTPAMINAFKDFITSRPDG
jgi:hypothetical protein